MKTIALICMLVVAGNPTLKEDVEAIEKVITTYAEAGDTQDTQLLRTVIGEEFRVTMNDTKEGVVKVIDRASFINFLDQKVFGGDKREVVIENLDVYNSTTATVKVALKGEKATMYNYLSLVKVNGKWIVVQDLVFM